MPGPVYFHPYRLPGDCGTLAAQNVESERGLYILEGPASYSQTVLAAPSEADSIARALELLAGAEDGGSFVGTFTYTSGPAYGLLLDAASRGWTRTVRGSDDPPAMLMRALGVQPAVDVAADSLTDRCS